MAHYTEFNRRGSEQLRIVTKKTIGPKFTCAMYKTVVSLVQNVCDIKYTKYQGDPKQFVSVLQGRIQDVEEGGAGIRMGTAHPKLGGPGHAPPEIL